jgi:hypothetical protein
MSLVWEVIAEAITAAYLAKKLQATQLPGILSTPQLPQNLAGVWKFCAPLSGTIILA